MMQSIGDSYQKTKSQIEIAAKKAGKKISEIEFIAVSKTWPKNFY